MSSPTPAGASEDTRAPASEAPVAYRRLVTGPSGDTGDSGDGHGGSPRSARRGMGTVRNMVISMAVIVAFVIVWLAMVPRVSQVSQPPVDVTSVAQQVRAETGWLISQPDLPDGWKATSVRFVRSTNGLMTWHAGYLSPDEQYVAIEQTQGATDDWVSAQTNRGRVIGTTEAGGRTWTMIDRQDKVQRSLVDRGEGPDDLTTVITGTATFPELEAFVEALQPVPASS